MAAGIVHHLVAIKQNPKIIFQNHSLEVLVGNEHLVHGCAVAHVLMDQSV